MSKSEKSVGDRMIESLSGYLEALSGDDTRNGGDSVSRKIVSVDTEHQDDIGTIVVHMQDDERGLRWQVIVGEFGISVERIRIADNQLIKETNMEWGALS